MQMLPPGSPQSRIVNAITGIAEEKAFWSFTDDFASTVDFDMEHASPEGVARLVENCASQFSYIRDNHPEHFRKLLASYSEPPKMINVIAAWVAEAGIDTRHFAGGSVRFTRAVDAHSRLASIFDPDTGRSRDPSVVVAAKLYRSAVGRVVRLSRYSDADGIVAGEIGKSEGMDGYELAIVCADDGQYDVVALRSGGEAASVWPVRLLTGPSRGEDTFVFGPTVRSVGSVDGEWVRLDATGRDLEPLDRDDLLLLASLDLDDLRGEEVYPLDATGVDGEGNKVVLNPGGEFPAVVDSETPGFMNVDEGHNGVLSVTVWLNVSSDEEGFDGAGGLTVLAAQYDTSGAADGGDFYSIPALNERRPAARKISAAPDTLSI